MQMYSRTQARKGRNQWVKCFLPATCTLVMRMCLLLITGHSRQLKKWTRSWCAGGITRLAKATLLMCWAIWKTRNADAAELIKSLNGQVILIKGNHDRFLHNAKAKEALAGLKDYDDICVTLEDGTKKRVILSHFFTPMYNGHRHQAIHLHAHSHFTDEADFEVDFARQLKLRAGHPGRDPCPRRNRAPQLRRKVSRVRSRAVLPYRP